MTHTGWRSRGYLPHVDGAYYLQHVVFGLADAFPNEAEAPADPNARAQWRETVLDAGHGCACLVDEAADVVEAALLHFDGERYALWAWCVMPNHVHAMVQTAHGHSLGAIVHSWKSFTANKINKIRDASGRLWRREYFDHFMRDDNEASTTRSYIEQNPVAAGLVQAPEHWRWSSAWAGRRG